MRSLSPLLLLLVLLPIGYTAAVGQAKPPANYVDKGACPFECCTYRRWKTLKDTVAYARPDKRSPRIGTFKRGTWVRGLTGEVRTVTPGKFVVTKPYEKYKPGDVLWVYTPMGEGFYKIWFKGRWIDEALYYMSGPYETSYPSCDKAPDCWGRLERELKTEWWVRVKSPAGWIGWTDQTENFGNMDACG